MKSARELLAECETQEQRDAVRERIESAIGAMNADNQAQAARGNESLTLPVIMARLQRRAGSRPAKPREISK